MTPTSPDGFYALVLTGLAAATLSLVLGRQRIRHPAPHDIEPRDGLGELVASILGWLGLVLVSLAAIIAAGIILPVAIAAMFLAASRVLDPGPGLMPLYRFRGALAFLGLLVALVLWIAVLALVQPVPGL